MSLLTTNVRVFVMCSPRIPLNYSRSIQYYKKFMLTFKHSFVQAKVYFEPLFGFILAKVDLPKSENQRSVSVLLIRKATLKLGLYNVLTVSLSRGITQNNVELHV